MPRLHHRLVHPNVEVDSPLIDCRLLDLSTSGIGFETGVGLRLGVPYPFRLRDGEQTLSTEAVVRWCRLVRNETIEGESRPVYRAGANFVDWQALQPMVATAERQIDETTVEQQIDEATVEQQIDEATVERQIDEATVERQIDESIDGWIRQNRKTDTAARAGRKIIRHANRRRLS